MLYKRQLSGFERRQHGFIAVIDVYGEASFGKRERQRYTDVSGTPDDSKIGRLRAGRTGPRRFGGCNVHSVPFTPEYAIIVANCALNLSLPLKRANWTLFQVLR